MKNYLRAKYVSYNYFSPCHVEEELLLSEDRAKKLMREVLQVRSIGRLFRMDFDQFYSVIETGLGD